MQKTAIFKCPVQTVGIEHEGDRSAQLPGKQEIRGYVFKQLPFFLLEAKTAPNNWQDIQEVYPQDELPSWYQERQQAMNAKSTLKSFLISKWKGRFKKFPIRVRKIF